MHPMHPTYIILKVLANAYPKEEIYLQEKSR